MPRSGIVRLLSQLSRAAAGSQCSPTAKHHWAALLPVRETEQMGGEAVRLCLAAGENLRLRGGFIFTGNGNGELNGYRALRTNNMPDSLNTDQYGIIFGDWSQFFIGQWGALELRLDPYTRLDEGIIPSVLFA